MLTNKRFLITTAIESTWNTSNPVLFLGEWCRIFSRRANYDYLNQKLLPYHWDDRAKYKNDFDYLKILYEKKLNHLSKCLGIIHNQTQDTRYWRIIIGPWLRFFIDALFDRYETIRIAYESGEVGDTWILNYELNSWVPNNFQEFYIQFTDDPWNHIIYSECIREIGIPYTAIEINLKPCSISIPRKSKTKMAFKRILNYIGKILPDNLNKITIVAAYMPKWQLLKLQTYLLQYPYFSIQNEININKPLDINVRALLKFSSPDAGFEGIINKLIPILMPKAYLENFAQLSSEAYKIFPKNTRVIVTANAYQADDSFKIWAACNVEKGVPLIIEQHGGNFGIGRVNQSEDHQVMIADFFASWGWSNESIKSIKPMPSLLLTEYNSKPNGSGDIIVALPSFPRYFYNFISFPAGGQFLNYIDEQLKLFSLLSGPARERLRIRLDSDSFGWEIKSRLSASPLKLMIETSDLAFNKRLKNCRLSLSTYNATTFLQTMAANFPTVIYLNHDYFEIRPEAQEMISKLKKVGILHETVESAALFINNHYDNILSWWEQEEVQKTRVYFCQTYAHTSKTWIENWATFLKKMY
jgi:putative transferase (TIGR04331 family)